MDVHVLWAWPCLLPSYTWHYMHVFGIGLQMVNYSVKRYAVFITTMNSIEMINWGVGMSLPNESSWRGWIFLFGILLNLRLPRGFMPNDFHGE